MIKPFLVLQLICFGCFAQTNLQSSITSAFEYKKFNRKQTDSIMSFRTPFGCYHRGSVLNSIILLTNAHILRVKVKGKVPDKYISFKIFSGRKSVDLEKILFEELKNEYKFKTSEIVDTCDVWHLVVEDSSKLERFSFERDANEFGNWYVDRAMPPLGTGADWKDMVLQGVTMSYFAQAIDRILEFPMLTDTNDNVPNPQRYKFRVYTDIFKDMDKANNYFREKYGIAFNKKKGTVKRMLIEFLENEKN
jgi:hypothetical protein